jgi:hypothetical protein
MSDEHQQTHEKEPKFTSKDRGMSQTNGSSSKEDFQRDAAGFLSYLDKIFTEWFVVKAPALPVNVKEGLVKYLPILNLIGLIISGVALLSAVSIILISIGLIGRFGGYYSNIYTGNTLTISFVTLLLGVVSFYFSYKAQLGLNTQKKSAWMNLWYAQLVGVVSTIVSSFFGNGFFLFSLIVGLAFNALFMYLLYQLKKYYKG